MDVDIGDGCIENIAFGFVHDCAVVDFATTQYGFIFWLSVASAAALVAIAIPRILYLCRSPSITRVPIVLLIAKVFVGLGVTGLRLGLLVITVRQTNTYTTTRSVASTALDFAASGLIIILSPLEHFKSTRPSIVICSYLFLAFVYDLTRCPSLWAASRRLHESHTTFNVLFTATVVVEFAFLVLESARRKRWIIWDAADHSPEGTSSIFSLGLYSWLNQLLWRGYHETLAMRHLYPLDRIISVETLDQRNIAGLSNESTGTSTWQLALWIVNSLPSFVLLPILPRLVLLAFTLSQPFFLQRLLSFLSSPETDTSTSSGLIAVTVFIYSGIAVSTAFYWYYQERFQSLLRAFLISAIYRKTATVPHVGDGDTAAVTLMGADVERIYTGLRLMHEVWACIIQIALAAWLLYRQLGLAFLAPLIIVVLGFAGSFALSRRAVRYQAAWMARVQSRIGVTSSVLANIKDLRISGMTIPATALVQHEREDEIRVGERSRMLIAISASLSQLPQAVAPALAFAFGPRVLDETRAYTALSLLALLTAPLMMVLQSIPIIAASIACLRRIKLFLIRDPRADGRHLKPTHDLTEKTKVLDAGQEPFISVQDGAFSWTPDHVTLQNININLPRSSITFVVGSVAAGKSTLCRALLGEMPYTQGRVMLGSDKLGYCNQVPLLFNASIMENIVGFSSFDLIRYTEVLQATMLVEDLRSLPVGDKTVIGTKGIALSGGQRQRVSLARALYHEADILIIDDVFSGLDGFTQEQVCKSVFGPDGVLRRRGTTALVCTHSIRFLPVADHIVVLSADGTIADQGCFSEILEDEQRSGRIGLSGTTDLITKIDNSNLGSDKSEIQAVINRSEVHDSSTKSPPTPTPPPPTIDLNVYRHWLSTIGPLPLVLYLILVIGIGFFSNFPTIWLKLWSTDSVKNSPEHSFTFWIGIYALLGAGAILCVFPAGLIVLRTAVRLSGTDLHRATINTIMRSSLRFLSNTDVGKVLNLFSQDMNIMDTQLPRMVNNMCFCLSTVIGQAVVIALSSAWLALSYPFFIAILWGVQRIYLPSSKRLRILDLEAKTPLYTNFLDTLAGLPTIRAFGWFPHYLARNNALLDDSQRPSYLLAMAQQWLALKMNVLVAILAVVLVSLATQLRSEAGNVGAGLVTLITLGTTLTSIVVAYTGLETSLGAISRLKSFGEETELEKSNAGDVSPDKAWPTRGRVQMQRVEASYDGTNKVLKGLNLIVEPGEKIALCGRTGSGKSSILALLMRLIEPLSSSEPESPDPASTPIRIDELPLNTIDHAILRERIISASQDPVFLPEGTLFRASLDPWNVASDAECTAVLRDLDLAGVVEAKGGLNAPVNGAELSTGQKQLFSLARAVLRRRVKLRETGIDGGLLLLDEITSSADAETERRVRILLENEFSAYTVIMVTHHREMAIACDRVIVLDAGKVVEDGKPMVLLEKVDGWFKKLFGS
ncbi:ABC transporter [Hypoxylon crocopeplum]|nr:ABC transporter [Hypoxylon crocopeplum]